jgi:hypothetical protein
MVRAEVYRIAGEIAPMSPVWFGSDVFRAALAVARAQQAKSGAAQPRAWGGFGAIKGGVMRRELRSVYGWFTEGFALDLKQPRRRTSCTPNSRFRNGLL